MKSTSIFLFFISPIVSLVTTFQKNKKVWPYVVFLALTFSWSETHDISRYLNEVKYWKNFDIFYFISNAFVENNEVDLLFPFLAFVSAKIGLGEHLFLALLGLVGGLFYQRFSNQVLDNQNDLSKSFCVFLTVVIFFCIPPWRLINGFRFSIVIVFYVSLILKNWKNTDYSKLVLLTLLLPLIHFSAWILVVTTLLFVIVFRYLPLWILFILVFLSFSTTILPLEEINLSVFGDFTVDRIEGYTSKEYNLSLEEKQGVTNIFISYQNELISTSILVILILFFVHRNKFIGSERTFLKFVLMSMTIFNFINIQASLGRFRIIGWLLVLIFFTKSYTILKSSNFKSYILFQNALYLFLGAWIIIQFRIGSELISIEFFYFNFPIALITDFDRLSLIDFFRSL